VVFAIEHHTGNEKNPEQLVNNAPDSFHHLRKGRAGLILPSTPGLL